MKATELHERIKQFVDDLAAETDAVRASTTFQNYLDAMSRFHQYSWHNQLLIVTQRPDAQRVAGFHTWLKLKRHVQKGEKGIAILAPLIKQVTADDGQTLRRLVNFRVVYVFDVSQTDGEPLPAQPDWKSSERQAALHKCLTQFANAEGVTVTTGELPDDARGASFGGQIILIPTASTKTLVHEIAHELMHRSHQLDERPSRSVVEIEAETTAYVICKHFGLGDTKSPNYLALWGADAHAIRARLDRIQKAAARIITAIDKPTTVEHVCETTEEHAR